MPFCGCLRGRVLMFFLPGQLFRCVTPVRVSHEAIPFSGQDKIQGAPLRSGAPPAGSHWREPDNR